MLAITSESVFIIDIALGRSPLAEAILSVSFLRGAAILRRILFFVIFLLGYAVGHCSEHFVFVRAAVSHAGALIEEEAI